MKDIWYSDKRDLIKWAVLFQLANKFQIDRILQIAYYRPCEYEKIDLDGDKINIPPEVIAHFRNITNIENINHKVKVAVLNKTLEDRSSYFKAIVEFMSKYSKQKCIIFLDPDTGLEPEGKSSKEHVLESEASGIWKEMKIGDIFVLYQHQTNRAGKPWINNKKEQLEKAIRVSKGSIKVAHGSKIANDVVIYYIQKNRGVGSS
jgi:hypothetical protein